MINIRVYTQGIHPVPKSPFFLTFSCGDKYNSIQITEENTLKKVVFTGL